jgi:hypothetical protein
MEHIESFCSGDHRRKVYFSWCCARDGGVRAGVRGKR